MKIKFETERLIVREWEEYDYKDLFEFASDSDVTKYLLYKTYESQEDAKLRIETLKEKYKTENRYGDFAIELKTENKVIGCISIILKSVQAGGIVELGWTLNKKYQGSGYMTECIKELLRYIKKNNLAKRIEGRHDTQNIKSGEVMKRCGMTFEGIARKSGDNNFHSRYDIAIYSILDEEIEL